MTSEHLRGSCEATPDPSRLRTMPYLPPEKRPTVITSRQGAAIPVDKVKVEGKEKILRRGEASPLALRVLTSFDQQKIHKRLEREIHPQEIVVHAVTREDVWGLRYVAAFCHSTHRLAAAEPRFLNMFSALEALISLGKCRELPVVGFVKGIIIMGVIVRATNPSRVHI